MIFLNPRSYIMTNKGIIRVNNLQKDMFIKDQDNNIYKIINLDKEKVMTSEITLKNGHSIYVHENNQLMTFDGFKNSMQINDADLILMKTHKGFNRNGGEKIDFEYKGRTSYNISIPEKFSPELAYWLGLITSRGVKDKCSIAINFNTIEKEKLDEFIVLTKKLFNVTPFKIEIADYILFKVTSYKLIKFLAQMIGVNSTLRKIPTQILKGSQTEIKAYIEGVTSHTYRDGKYPVIYSGSSPVIRDFLFYYLSYLGYGLYKKNTRSGTGNLVYYLYIQASPYSDFLNHNLENNKIYKIPDSLFSIPRLSKKNPSYSSFKMIKFHKKTYCYGSILDNIGVEYNREEYFVKVKKIKYDLKQMIKLEIIGLEKFNNDLAVIK